MIVLIGWLAALLFAGVVLGFAVYELSWKFGRLRTERARLRTLISGEGRNASVTLT